MYFAVGQIPVKWSKKVPIMATTVFTMSRRLEVWHPKLDSSILFTTLLYELSASISLHLITCYLQTCVIQARQIWKCF